MPLHPGKSKTVIRENISEMEASGHPHAQAVAASLHNADKYGYEHARDEGRHDHAERNAVREEHERHKYGK